jgi:hypothetical protein
MTKYLSVCQSGSVSLRLTSSVKVVNFAITCMLPSSNPLNSQLYYVITGKICCSSQVQTRLVAKLWWKLILCTKPELEPLVGCRGGRHKHSRGGPLLGYRKKKILTVCLVGHATCCYCYKVVQI